MFYALDDECKNFKDFEIHFNMNNVTLQIYDLKKVS